MKKIKFVSRTKKYSAYVFIGMLVIVVITLFILLFKEKKSYSLELENKYNMAFFQLVDNVQDMEVYLAKSTISNSPNSGAEILSFIWREANMAQTYLSMLPIGSNEIEKTSKFLNQVSDYSYILSQKTINGEQLTQEELDNLEQLHNYSSELKNTLNQMAVDINSNKLSWTETSNNKFFKNKRINNFNDQISSVEENFHEYAGLIYDGAFSEHITNPEHKGLIGEDIDEQKARDIAIKTVGENRIKNITYGGLTNEGSIESYDYCIECNDRNMWWISITKKGGHILYINSNREVRNQNINDEDASKAAEEFLNNNGFNSMKKTYYTRNNGVETINYAYEENNGMINENIIVYPDLIKVKVALDNGEILGMEATGYLNSHTDRNVSDIKITKEEALASINSKLNIENIRLAIIPTEYNSEKTCWEIKGNVMERDFLVYVNVENGKEEDILLILNSSEGTITM